MSPFARFALSLALSGLLVVATATLPGCSSGSPPAGDGAAPDRPWTILFYGAGDGDERSLLKALARIKAGLTRDRGVEVVALIDRSGQFPGGEDTFGEEFRGARMYRFIGGRTERLGGGQEFPEIGRSTDADLNMGDARTLQQFIRFGKANFPARHYALAFFGHGCGVYFCPDTRHVDALQPAKVSAVLTENESVDLVIFDVCSMGGIEVAYQWRPGNGSFQTSIMVAAPSSSDALPYDRILQGLRTPGVSETESSGIPPPPAPGLNPATMTARALGKHIIRRTEAQRLEVGRRPRDAYDAWACYDLSRAATVKEAVDGLAVELARTEGAKEVLGAVRGRGMQPVTLHYMDRQALEKCWPHTPYFDLYDLVQRVRESDALPAAVRGKAGAVMKAVEQLIIASFGEKVYADFQPGRNGVYIVFPDGDAVSEDKRHWETCCRWYSPLAVSGGRQVYGRLSWCRDGAIAGNGVVENWFELLDSWYDSTNDESGGVNRYQW